MPVAFFLLELSCIVDIQLFSLVAFNSAREKKCSLRRPAVIHVEFLPTEPSAFGLSLDFRYYLLSSHFFKNTYNVDVEHVPVTPGMCSSETINFQTIYIIKTSIFLPVFLLTLKKYKLFIFYIFQLLPLFLLTLSCMFP